MNQIEGVISIKDLFAELVRKSVLIILCAVIFALALGGYKLINNLQAQKNVDNVAQELTEEQIEAVLDYVAKVKEQESLETYIEGSVLLSLNPYDVYRTELQYFIKDEKDTSNLSTIRAAYADYALFGRLANDVAADLDTYDEHAIRDVLETDSYIREQDPDLRTVRIMVFAKDEKQTEELVASVKKQIENYCAEINQTIESHKFVLLDENTHRVLKTDLIGKKDYWKEQLKTVETEADMLEDQLNATQMSYATELLGDEVEDQDVSSQEKKPGIGIKSILKYAILGGALGFAGCVVMIVALYFFSSQIKQEKDTEYVHGISHLGNGIVYKRKCTDKLADTIFYKDKILDFEMNAEQIVNKIVEICKEKEVAECAFIGMIDEPANQAIDCLIQKLMEQKINAVAFDIEGKKELPQNVILVESIRKTTEENVKSQIDFCVQHQLEVLGYLTLSK